MSQRNAAGAPAPRDCRDGSMLHLHAIRERIRMAATIAAMLIACFCATSASAQETTHEDVMLRAQVFELLDAYARNDQAAVLALLDRDSLDVYGSDVSEHAVGVEAFLEMMDADHALWSGTGRVEFGSMNDISVRMHGDLATVFFNTPFRVGETPQLTVRFATVWLRKNGRWLLTQSASAVPTVGSSARELIAD